MPLSPSSLQQLLQPLQLPIEPIRKSPLYFAGLVATAVFVVLMPAVYVALIAVVTWACFWYLGSAFFLWGLHISGFWGVLIKAFLYFAPVLAGFTMVIFMVKPLTTKFERPAAPRRLEAGEAPEFFALVNAIADAVGAPRPAAVFLDAQVNASASFEDGLRGLLRRRLVLTVGLPLVGSLDTREVAGILAHEFGHFAQGGGMRLSFVVRKLNHWFQRIVQHRDSWDAALEEAATESDPRLGVFFWLAKAFVWLSRRALWVLAIASHFVCLFLLRQMEYDADRYEARVAGALQFAQTAHRLRRLNLAWQRAGQIASRAWTDRKLPRDFFALLGFLETRIDAGNDLALRKSLADEKPSLWRTHPLDRERNARSLQTGDAGLVTLALPCRDLFVGFPGLAAACTQEFYGKTLEQEITEDLYVPTEAVIAELLETEKDAEAFGRLVGPFAGLILPLRVPPVAEVACSPSELRSRLRESLPDIRTANDGFDGRFAALRAAQERQIARSAGFTVPEEPPTAGDEETYWSEVGAAAAQLRTSLVPLAERLAGALRTSQTLSSAELSKLLAANDGFLSLEAPVQNLVVDLGALRFLGGQESPPDQDRHRTVGAWMDAVHKNLVVIAAGLNSLEDPFSPAGSQTVSQVLFRQGIPEPSDFNAVFQAADQFLGLAGSYYNRLLGKLCRAAETEEARQGWQPMELVVP